jgi:arabinose-5-phosphate isomerase
MISEITKKIIVKKTNSHLIKCKFSSALNFVSLQLKTFNKMKSLSHLSNGRNTIIQELKSLESLAAQLGNDFELFIQNILNSSQVHSNTRVIVTGIGKSAIIAQKIVATLNSTGQPALFMHAADAIHGDLGMIQANDLIIAISKSGNTPEIVALIPLLKRLNNPFAAIVGNINSQLAKEADFVLDATVDKEACPNNLAPTTSTTAQLLIGDAIAMALLTARNFSDQDFSKFHPGGALGKKLYLRCGDITQKHSKPFVNPDTSWNEVILNITQHRLGATAVIDSQNNIVGIITDGDIRRMLSNHSDLSSITAQQIMGKNPTTLYIHDMATLAASVMQEKKITQLIIIGEDSITQTYEGMIHLHDLYQEGIL